MESCVATRFVALDACSDARLQADDTFQLPPGWCNFVNVVDWLKENVVGKEDFRNPGCTSDMSPSSQVSLPVHACHHSMTSSFPVAHLHFIGLLQGTTTHRAQATLHLVRRTQVAGPAHPGAFGNMWYSIALLCRVTNIYILRVGAPYPILSYLVI